MEKQSFFNAQKFVPLNPPQNVILALAKEDNKKICTDKNAKVLALGSSENTILNTFIIPNILTHIHNNESYIVTDPKGKIFEKTYSLAKKSGFNISVLNLTSISNSDRWDMLKSLKNCNDNELTDSIDEFASLIFKNKKEKALFKALSYFLVLTSDEISAYSLFRILTDFSHNNYIDFSVLKPSQKDYIQTCLNICQDKSKTISNILNKLIFLTDDIKREFLSYDDLTFEGNSAVYIIAEPHNKEHQLIAKLLLNQIYNDVLKNSWEGHLILTDIEEFGNIKKLPYTLNDLDNTSVSLVVSDIKELNKYHKEKIMNNIDIFAIYPTRNKKIEKFITNRFGEEACNSFPSFDEEKIFLISDNSYSSIKTLLTIDEKIDKYSYTNYEPDWVKDFAFDEKELQIKANDISRDTAKISNKKIFESGKNIVVLGSAGSGKTTAFVLPSIEERISNGESYIVNDPAGSIYKKTSNLAKEKGYTIKVLNIRNPEFSNGWNPLSTIKASDSSDKMSLELAETIINNTQGNINDEYFKLVEKMFLAGVIYHVAVSPEFKGRENERHIGTVYDILTSLIQNVDMEEFERLPMGTSDAIGWAMFRASDDLRRSIVASLVFRLSILQNDVFKELFSHDEIDLSQINKEKYAVYVISPITSRKAVPVLASFFTLAMNVLTESKGEIPVCLILDEIHSAGIINNLSDKLVALKNHNASVSLTTMSLELLEKLYSPYLLANCDIWLALFVNDIYTAEILSKRSGVKIENAKLKPELSTDEILTYFFRERDNMLVFDRGKAPVEIKKSFWSSKDVKENDAKNFIPDWKNKDYNVIGKPRTYTVEFGKLNPYNKYNMGDILTGKVNNITDHGYFVRVNEDMDIFCKDINNIKPKTDDTVEIIISGKDRKTQRIWGKIKFIIK